MDAVGRNIFSVVALRKIRFPVHHLPKDMPNYWKTIKEFAGTDATIPEIQTAVQNIKYLYQEAFATDEELLQKICKESVGVVLMISEEMLILWGKSSHSRRSF